MLRNELKKQGPLESGSMGATAPIDFEKSLIAPIDFDKTPISIH